MPMIPTLFPPPIAPQFFRGENLIFIDIMQLTTSAVQIYKSIHYIVIPAQKIGPAASKG